MKGFLIGLVIVMLFTIAIDNARGTPWVFTGEGTLCAKEADMDDIGVAVSKGPDIGDDLRAKKEDADVCIESPDGYLAKGWIVYMGKHYRGGWQVLGISPKPDGPPTAFVLMFNKEYEI